MNEAGAVKTRRAVAERLLGGRHVDVCDSRVGAEAEA
jgi:hypothetical protein